MGVRSPAETALLRLGMVGVEGDAGVGAGLERGDERGDGGGNDGWQRGPDEGRAARRVANTEGLVRGCAGATLSNEQQGVRCCLLWKLLG